MKEYIPRTESETRVDTYIKVGIQLATDFRDCTKEVIKQLAEQNTEFAAAIMSKLEAEEKEAEEEGDGIAEWVSPSIMREIEDIRPGSMDEVLRMCEERVAKRGMESKSRTNEQANGTKKPSFRERMKNLGRATFRGADTIHY